MGAFNPSMDRDRISSFQRIATGSLDTDCISHHGWIKMAITVTKIIIVIAKQKRYNLSKLS